MKRYVKSAETTSAEDRLADTLDRIKDDFDYAVGGIEKLAADGQVSDAMDAATSLQEEINGIIDIISSQIAQ